MKRMEQTITQNVRELDLTLQPRPAPRYKVWLPLATQQLRLRSLYQLIGYNLIIDKNFETCWFYFTLHRSTMSSPLYTSEPIDNTSPQWPCLDVPTLHATGLSTASEIVLRLWRRTIANDPSTDITVFTSGISFTGLVYMGPELSNNWDSMLRHNSLIFHLHGGYFVPSYCLLHPPEFRRYLYMSVNNSEICDSYTVSKLSNLRHIMLLLKHQGESVQRLRDRIASGESIQSSKFKQTALNRLLQPKRISKEKKNEILKMIKELEIAKFRTKLLDQERMKKVGELRILNQLHLSIVEENQDHGSILMERYRELNKDIERLREWHQNHTQTRECYVQTLAQLVYRQRQLISDISLINQIRQESERKFTINNVHLPDSEELDKSNDTQTSVALGYVAQTTQVIANFLNVPTRYSIVYYGSKSKILDHITNNIPAKDRQFPLFSRSKDKLQFHYGVYLLNKNIAQLRWYCGLPTPDLRATLPNLASLINIKFNQTLDNSKRTFSGSSLDTDTSNNGKLSVSLTPPLQRTLDVKTSEIVHGSTRDKSQLKTSKALLGSSLDQGLNKSTETLILTLQMKRICKSEESTIDDKIFSLPRNNFHNSSDETIHNNNGNSRLRAREKLDASASSSSGIIGMDIEITMPISIYNSKYEHVNLRQRSSNSISSCEMALSGSQTDVVGRFSDISNDGVVNSTNKGNTSLIMECSNPEFIKLMKEETNSESFYLSGNHSMIMNDSEPYKKEQKNEDTSLYHHVVNNSNETHANSITYVDITNDLCKRIDSVSIAAPNCPENTKSFNAESKNDALMKNLRVEPSSSLKTSLKCEKIKNMKPVMAISSSLSQPNKVQEVVNDYRASTELIDSIRKSSENVFARTEALASKKTSFKVMKPRS